METRFLLIGQNLFNSKSHDLVNIHLPKYFKTFIFNNIEMIEFIKQNNSVTNTILIYCQSNRPSANIFIFPIVKFIKESKEIIKSNIIFFTFDWWLTEDSYVEYNKAILEIFSPINYKLISFSDKNIISQFHKKNYQYNNNFMHNNLWCCYNSSFIKFNLNPIIKIAVPGTRNYNSYPERCQLSRYENIETILYNHNNLKDPSDNNFNLALNKYIACFTSSVYSKNATLNKYDNTHCILLKNFEILAAGSLLVVPESESSYLTTELGLIENKHFLTIDFFHNIQKQINEILSHPQINSIRNNGQQYAKQNLNSEIKFNEIRKLLNF